MKPIESQPPRWSHNQTCILGQTPPSAIESPTRPWACPFVECMALTSASRSHSPSPSRPPDSSPLGTFGCRRQRDHRDPCDSLLERPPPRRKSPGSPSRRPSLTPSAASPRAARPADGRLERTTRFAQTLRANRPCRQPAHHGFNEACHRHIAFSERHIDPQLPRWSHIEPAFSGQGEPQAISRAPTRPWRDPSDMEWHSPAPRGATVSQLHSLRIRVTRHLRMSPTA